MTAPREDTTAYCAARAQEADEDRFLAARYAPPEARTHLHALSAFEAELANARHAVSEPALGEIRLQWWREAIDEIFAGGPVRAHPVVQGIHAAIATAGLPHETLEAAVDAHTAELYGAPLEDMAALERFLAARAGAGAALALKTLGGAVAAETLGTAAAAYGLARLAYAPSADAELLPDEAFEAAGVTRETVSADAAGARRLRRFLSGRARALYADARADLGGLAPEAAPAVLHFALTPVYAAGEGRARTALLGARKRARLFAAALTGRF